MLDKQKKSDQKIRMNATTPIFISLNGSWWWLWHTELQGFGVV